MTPPKKWPENCENARIDCISLARNSYRLTERLMDMVHGDDALRMLHKVSTNCLTIQNKLIEIKGRDLNRIIDEYLNKEFEEGNAEKKE